MEESKQPYMQCEICGFWDSRLDAEVWRVEDLAKFALLDGPDRWGVAGLCAGIGHLFFYRGELPAQKLCKCRAGRTPQNFDGVLAAGGIRFNINFQVFVIFDIR